MVKIFDVETHTIYEMKYKEFKEFYAKRMIEFYTGRFLIYG